jgi:hypothetical protein
MKKVILLLVLVPLLAEMSLALDLGGKTGFGLRADTFSIRRFVNNNFGLDLSLSYAKSTESGLSDSNSYNYSLGGFYAREIFTNTLFEAGATLQGWQGSDAGDNYNGVGINPFIGGEVFINDHVSLDGKVFLGDYYCVMMGSTRVTRISALDGNLGAHIYF